MNNPSKLLTRLQAKYATGRRVAMSFEEGPETIFKALGGPISEPQAPIVAPKDLAVDPLPTAVPTHPAVKAHAIALLRANLNAAHEHYQNSADALTQALSGDNGATLAANLAVPQTLSSG